MNCEEDLNVNPEVAVSRSEGIFQGLQDPHHHFKTPHPLSRPPTPTISSTKIAGFYGLLQERRNSSALALKLRLSCINPSR